MWLNEKEIRQLIGDSIKNHKKWAHEINDYKGLEHSDFNSGIDITEAVKLLFAHLDLKIIESPSKVEVIAAVNIPNKDGVGVMMGGCYDGLEFTDESLKIIIDRIK